MIYYQRKEQKDEQIYQIEIKSIVPNPNQPRKVFTEEGIIKLADSINRYGIIQPLTVRKVGEEYELIAGERRLRAAKELGLTHVPCMLMDVNQEKSAEISIIENLLRENLNIFEQAEAIEALIDTYHLTQEEIASKLSSSQSYIANKLRLLRLSSEDREIIVKNGLSERHARALLRINDQDLRKKLLMQIVNDNLNVAESEILIEKSLVNESSATDKRIKTYKNVNAFYTALNRAIDQASATIPLKTRKIEGEKYTELTILIPKATNEEEKAEADTEKALVTA